MTQKINPIPEGSCIIPYLAVKDAVRAAEYYKQAFGATEIGRITMPDGKLGHCELQIGNSRIMLAEEFPEWGNRSPLSLGGTPVGLCIYFEDVDTVFRRAIELGGKTEQNMEVKDQFYGDRSGTFTDPFGHKWTLAMRIEEVTFEEMQRRSDAMFSSARA